MMAKFPFKSYSKYRNKKVEVDGITFDSIKESQYYAELKLKKRAKLIKGLEMQVPFILQPSFTDKWTKKKIQAIKYIADFVVEHNDGTKEIIDVKGYRTKLYQVKKKLVMHKYPEYKFTEV